MKVPSMLSVSDREPDLPPAEFTDRVRDALLHLYDGAHLQTHPLAQMVNAQPGNSAILRGKLLLQTLLDAIRSLRPADGTPSDSRGWRIYELLERRYIEGLSVGEVLDHLSLGKTQYHRDHARALESVASLLWDRYGHRHRSTEPSEEAESLEALALTETAALAVHMNPDHIDLAGVLTDLLSLLQPVVDECRETLTLYIHPGIPAIYGDRVALRQIFLGLLNTAIERAVGGVLDIRAGFSGEDVGVTITASSRTSVVEMLKSPERSSLGLEVARQLVEALGGRLVVDGPKQDRSWSARIAIPTVRRSRALVVDNHPDFIGLITRYLAEHGWQVVGAQDTPQAEALARELRPDVVLLDVMIPGHDGWDLLLALKTREETRQIPVVICSILYEPQLARALGAVAYLPKPISQAALLEALAPFRAGRIGPASSA